VIGGGKFCPGGGQGEGLVRHKNPLGGNNKKMVFLGPLSGRKKRARAILGGGEAPHGRFPQEVTKTPTPKTKPRGD